MKQSNRYYRILAIDPCPAGFAFALLEGGRRLVDWGIVQVWSEAEAALLSRVEQFVERYSPSLIVVEDAVGSRLRRVARKKIRSVVRYAQGGRLPISTVSRKSVKEVFAGQCKNRREIAAAIVEVFPELRTSLPHPRRTWLSEDSRLHIFDAIALALALPAGASVSS